LEQKTRIGQIALPLKSTCGYKRSFNSNSVPIHHWNISQAAAQLRSTSLVCRDVEFNRDGERRQGTPERRKRGLAKRHGLQLRRPFAFSTEEGSAAPPRSVFRRRTPFTRLQGRSSSHRGSQVRSYARERRGMIQSSLREALRKSFCCWLKYVTKKLYVLAFFNYFYTFGHKRA
jgi:hypothetical protein